MNTFYDIELNKEMHKIRNDFLTKLSKIVHPSHIESFAKVLHYSWQENLEEADKITEELNIYPIDFVAFTDYIQEFEELYLKETERMVDYG